MGLFGKLFDKKECSICGGEIGLLGNRKLDDGNMCKSCAAKLSPWFSGRRKSTVADIQQQLAYREENRRAVQMFHTTRTLGRNVKVLLDEDNRKFMVTSASNIAEANPDVLDYSQVTGVDFNIDEHRSEDYREDKEGKKVSYNPRKFFYSYDFHITIFVNHPYFNEMKFRLCNSDVQTGVSYPEMRKPSPRINPEYQELEDMGNEIKSALTGIREQIREDAAAAAAPRLQTICPSCGATTIPDETGCCEYCGTPIR